MSNVNFDKELEILRGISDLTENDKDKIADITNRIKDGKTKDIGAIRKEIATILINNKLTHLARDLYKNSGFWVNWFSAKSWQAWNASDSKNSTESLQDNQPNNQLPTQNVEEEKHKLQNDEFDDDEYDYEDKQYQKYLKNNPQNDPRLFPGGFIFAPKKKLKDEFGRFVNQQEHVIETQTCKICKYCNNEIKEEFRAEKQVCKWCGTKYDAKKVGNSKRCHYCGMLYTQTLPKITQQERICGKCKQAYEKTAQKCPHCNSLPDVYC